MEMVDNGKYAKNETIDEPNETHTKRKKKQIISNECVCVCVLGVLTHFRIT